MRRMIFALAFLGACATCCAGIVNVTGLVPDNESAASANVTAIQSAITSAGDGGTCVFPAGVYYVDSTISFNVSGVAYKDITFDGNSGTTLRRISTGLGSFTIIQVGSGWSYLGMTIDGNRGSDVPNWSWGFNCGFSRSKILIKDCTVKNVPYDGIHVADESGNITIENCTIIDNHRQGIAFTDTIGNGVIKGCYFNNNAFQGLDIEPGSHDTLTFAINNCTFDGANDLTIWGSSHGSADIDVADCNFINGADLVGNRAVGEIRANNNTFATGSAVIFNSFNNNTDGTGKISLTANTIADVTNNGIDLIANGGFELWTSGNPDSWTILGGGTVEETIDVNDVLAETKALHISNVSGITEVQQIISASAGAFYTYGYYVKSGDPNIPLVRMKVEFLDSGSSVLETQKLLPILAKEYEKVMGIAQAPGGTVSIRISVGGDGSFNALFDEVFMFEGIGPDGGDLTKIADGIIQSYLFDFDDDRSGNPNYDLYLTAPHYTSVLPTTTYDPNIGYGVVGSGPFNPRSGSETVSFDPLYRDAIEFATAGDYFRVDVPNGQYWVTAAFGIPSFSAWQKGRINDVDYHWATNPASAPYGVDPNDGSIKVLDALAIPHTLVDVQGDSSRAGSFDQIRVEGYAAGNIAIGFKSEFLYIDRTLVSVNSGHIKIEPTATTGNRWIAMVKIERLVPTTCAQVKTFGLLRPADINEDCYVNFTDFAMMAGNWLVCNDPVDNSCIETW